MRWLFSFKDPQGQMTRWLEVLAQYNFKIVQREGKKHTNADSLSRRYERVDFSNCYMPRVTLEQLPCKGCKKCQKMMESWKQFPEEVDDVIPLAIQVCDANKHPHRPLRAALGDFRVGASMDRVGIDIMGPLPISKKGNTCILVVADYFTCWIEAYPLPDQQAETVARTFVNQFIS